MSTTAEKIKVMQAFENGAEIECRYRGIADRLGFKVARAKVDA